MRDDKEETIQSWSLWNYDQFKQKFRKILNLNV